MFVAPEGWAGAADRYPRRVIDLKLLRDQPDVVRASQVARGDDPALVDAVLDADALRRSSLAEFEQLRAEQKAHGKKVAQAASPEERAELLRHTKELAENVKAREAEAGAEVVVAAGGDGTVRAVATTLQGTGVPMGLLPVGTGNLLARNLDIPVTDLARSLEIALEGRDRAIDVAWLRVTDAPAGDDAAEVGSEHIFLVIAGIGFDAAMIADTDTTLKAKVGWIAYFLGGIRHLHGRRLEARVLLDDTRRSSMKLRTLLIGNCGRLPGGITLLPDALVDDGILDVAAIDTRAGVAGWAQLFGEVVMQGLGVQPLATNRIGRIDHTQCRSIAVRVPDGAQAQVDGDPVGRATAIECRVDHADLLVRVPRALTL